MFRDGSLSTVDGFGFVEIGLLWSTPKLVYFTQVGHNEILKGLHNGVVLSLYFMHYFHRVSITLDLILKCHPIKTGLNPLERSEFNCQDATVGCSNKYT